jgi:molecular chaperone GrpE
MSRKSDKDDNQEKNQRDIKPEPSDDEPQVTVEGPEVEILDPAQFEPAATEDQSRADELLRENQELTDSLKRLKADFENYRKRMLREQTRILESAEADLIKKLLPAVDNLERAIASAHSDEPSPLRDGVQMVHDQVLEILKKEGLEVIDPEGEPFDPEHHEAMMVVETEECPEDTVVEVVQKGYRFGGILLRPAMVKVSCAVK